MARRRAKSLCRFLRTESPTQRSMSRLHRLVSLSIDLKRVISILIQLLCNPFWLIMSKNIRDAAKTWPTSKLQTGHGMTQAEVVEARQNKSAIWRNQFCTPLFLTFRLCKYLCNLFSGSHEYISRSHIDTTAVQALIDARSVIQKWADQPVEVSPYLLQISDLHYTDFCLVPFRYYPLSLDSSCPCSRWFWHWYFGVSYWTWNCRCCSICKGLTHVTSIRHRKWPRVGRRQEVWFRNWFTTRWICANCIKWHSILPSRLDCGCQCCGKRCRTCGIDLGIDEVHF